MKDILAFDLVENSFLFEDEKTSKLDNKSQLTICLEAFIEIDDFCFNETRTTKTSVIVDFMSLVRKIFMKKFNIVYYALTYTWKKIPDIANADEIHIVYESFLENSLKGHERLRTEGVEPIKFVNPSRQSPVPVQLERFWTCLVNKVNLQSITRKFQNSEIATSNPFQIKS